MDPDPRTLRELLWLAEGADRARWVHTSGILAMLYNANRDPKRSRARKPREFDPYARGATRKATMDELQQIMTARPTRRGERIR